MTPCYNYFSLTTVRLLKNAITMQGINAFHALYLSSMWNTEIVNHEQVSFSPSITNHILVYSVSNMRQIRQWYLGTITKHCMPCHSCRLYSSRMYMNAVTDKNLLNNLAPVQWHKWKFTWINRHKAYVSGSCSLIINSEGITFDSSMKALLQWQYCV